MTCHNQRITGIQRFLLLGGGETCARFAAICAGMNAEVLVATSPRHAAELVERVGFTAWLSAREISYRIYEKLDAAFLREEARLGTLVMSFGAAWILKADLIETFEGRVVNVHPAPLPLHRGAGGYSWRIMNGDRRGGLCIHLVDEGLDTGPIIRSEFFTYPLSCRTPADFGSYTMERNLVFLKSFAQDVLAGTSFRMVVQDESHSTYFPRLNTERHGWIDWAWSSADLCRFIDAFDEPYGGASSMLGDRRVRLSDCDLAGDGPMHPFLAGLVYRISSDAAWVAAGGGGIRLARVQEEDGPCLLSQLRLGDRFHTPILRLEEARNFRPVYTSTGLQ